jgi:hypothetical protein
MPARVTVTQVKTLTGGPTSDPTQAIATANTLANHWLLPITGYPAPLLAQVELYLAAHFSELTTKNGPLASEGIDTAIERYHDIYKPGLRSTRFGQQAILLDYTGTLAEVADLAENPGRRKAIFQVV